MPLPPDRGLVGRMSGGGAGVHRRLQQRGEVDIALGVQPFDQCSQFDVDGNGGATIDELLGGVNNALHDCS